jgi:hypothetical protein
MRPGYGLKPSALLIKGRRECRALDAPAALRAKVESTQASHHGHTGNTRHSPHNGFTVSFVLSPVIGLSCHRHLTDSYPRSLTPASRRQDHTTSPSADQRIRLCAIRVHRIPRSAFVTIAKRPSQRRRDGGGCIADLGKGRSGIFFQMGLDDPNHVDPPQQNSVLAQAPGRWMEKRARDPIARPFQLPESLTPIARTS